jgi:hypothetical protein
MEKFAVRFQRPALSREGELDQSPCNPGLKEKDCGMTVFFVLVPLSLMDMECLWGWMGLTVLFFSLGNWPAEARVIREDIGELKIHDLLLRPSAVLKEPKSGSFSIGESSFALRWELQDKFSGVVRIGPRTLINPLARYQQKVADDVTLVEAFAEYEDAYGRFRFGRLPVEFGYEGKLWERALIFPRSLLFQRRIVMLRDVGFSYEIEHNNFYTGFVVHNGESDNDIDGRTWYTARWGYRKEDFEIGLSGQTGSTKPIATETSKDTLAGVDPLREAKWRILGAHWAVNRGRTEWVIEAYMGEREQQQDGVVEIGRYNAGHADVGYLFTKTFSAHLRYDHLDKNSKIKTELERQASLGLVFSNKTKSSNLILVGTKVMEKGDIANDEFRVIWSLSPSGIVRF